MSYMYTDYMGHKEIGLDFARDDGFVTTVRWLLERDRARAVGQEVTIYQNEDQVRHDLATRLKELHASDRLINRVLGNPVTSAGPATVRAAGVPQRNR